MENYKTIYRLDCPVRDYAWGGNSFLAALTGRAEIADRPAAELWIGAHSGAPSLLIEGEKSVNLADFIAQNPAEILGKKTAERFANRLPFLFKILDVNKMLSIQTHPSKARAEAGFLRENETGIPLSAAHRNYRDDNHKPEIMLALSDFWLLHGFRSAAEIAEILEQVPEFAPLRAGFSDRNIKNLYARLMEMPQKEADKLLKPLISRLSPLYEAGKLAKNSPDFWAGRAAHTFARTDGSADRGLFSVYLLNLVNIPAGKGIFQPAGILHAYLEGQNAELMANSDNVLRGGLTIKHIDVPELLENTVFEPIVPEILSSKPATDGREIFKTEAPDFELSVFRSEKPVSDFPAISSVRALILLEGSGRISSGKVVLEAKKGEVFFAPAGTGFCLEGNGNTWVCAGLPN